MVTSPAVFCYVLKLLTSEFQRVFLDVKRSTGVGFDLLRRAKAANFSSNRLLTKLIKSNGDNVYTSGFYILFNCIFCDFSNITRPEFNVVHVQTCYCK